TDPKASSSSRWNSASSRAGVWPGGWSESPTTKWAAIAESSVTPNSGGPRGRDGEVIREIHRADSLRLASTSRREESGGNGSGSGAAGARGGGRASLRNLVLSDKAQKQ